MSTHSAEPPPVVPLVLAAGFSSRMGQCKALLVWRKTTFLDFICTQLARAGLPQPIVVVPASDDTICRLHSTQNVVWARNPHPEDGMLSSIRAGLAHLPRERHVMICLVDHPAVRVRTYRAVARIAQADRIVIPVWQGRRGHPVVFGSAFRDELQHGECPEGARSIVQAHPEAVRTIAVCDRGIICDVDTPGSYAYLLSKQAGMKNVNKVRVQRPEIRSDWFGGAQSNRKLSLFSAFSEKRCQAPVCSVSAGLRTPAGRRRAAGPPRTTNPRRSSRRPAAACSLLYPHPATLAQPAGLD